MTNTLYTIGYEESDVSTFLKKVQAAGVQTVLDIRELPQSRILGFSKTALADALRRKNINYVHVRELGSPRKLRHELRRTGDFTAFTRGYLLYLKNKWSTLERSNTWYIQNLAVCFVLKKIIMSATANSLHWK
jgi:uncharacterized protein (DUF488 family)